MLDRILIIVFILGVVGCKNNQSTKLDTKENSTELTNNYSGSWAWKKNDETSSFKIKIKQNQDSLIAQYCAAAYSGNRLDCEFEEQYNIRGVIVEKNTMVTFYSFFGAKNGKALIEFYGDSFKWKIIEWPTGGDCFAPETAILERE